MVIITINSIKWLSVAEPYWGFLGFFLPLSSVTNDSKGFENNDTSFMEDEVYGKKFQTLLIQQLWHCFLSLPFFLLWKGTCMVWVIWIFLVLLQGRSNFFFSSLIAVPCLEIHWYNFSTEALATSSVFVIVSAWSQLFPLFLFLSTMERFLNFWFDFSLTNNIVIP